MDQAAKEIYVIEQSCVARSLMAEILQSRFHGYEVKIMTDEAEVFASLALKDQPSLILASCEIQGESSSSLIKDLRKQFSDIPVVVLCADLQSANTQYFEELDCQVISKPLTTEKARGIVELLGPKDG